MAKRLNRQQYTLENESQTTHQEGSQMKTNSSSEYTSWSLHALQDMAYEVRLENNIFNSTNSSLKQAVLANGSSNSLVFIDDNVDHIHGSSIKQYFDKLDISYKWVTLPSGEEQKNMDRTLEVIDHAIDIGLLRKSDSIIAIGGGVVTDIVGFAASLYRRGASYIRVPTTLMGQIDAGIGVKTGINYANKKNRLGTYYPPKSVVIDPYFLTTTTQRHINNGIAEVVKMALIKDYRLYQVLKKLNRQIKPNEFGRGNHDLQAVLSYSIEGMLEELEPNFQEDNLKRLVDFGHTFSPILEMKHSDSMLHGEAVAIDMAFSVALSNAKGLLTNDNTVEIFTLMRNLGLETYCSSFTKQLIDESIKDAIKHRNGDLNLPLPTSIGKAQFVNEVTDLEIQKALETVFKLSSQ
ncbi:sedoheptulose 7-phosphate cyclase [Vibrio sp. WXL103]|uniref:sedoheptulose 7-phosphate cyclase n=1 Tax=Vibrio sp. WXL103 TaxID=3450710 RepID=UPI003EC8990B